jgi:hypothetical protein
LGEIQNQSSFPEGFKTSLQTPVSLVYLMQHEFKDFITSKRKSKAKGDGSGKGEAMKSKGKCPSFKAEQKEVALRLLSLRVLVLEVRRICRVDIHEL